MAWKMGDGIPASLRPVRIVSLAPGDHDSRAQQEQSMGSSEFSAASGGVFGMQRVMTPSRETCECRSCGAGAMRPDHTSADRQRLDKWLWCARFFKTRALAAEAVGGGKVHLNDERVKPAHSVRIGDRLSLLLHGAVAEFDVVGLPERRGPAAEAKAHYIETVASAERRARLHEQQRLANLTRPRSVTRPDKRDRRRLVKLHRGQT